MEKQDALTKAVEEMNSHLRNLTKNQSFFHSFMSGLFSGLGSVIGATFVVALLLWVLGHLQLVPLIGAWLADIVKVVQQNLAIH